MLNQEADDLRLKITLCGDYAVGKTSIARRFSGKSFKKSYKATVGVDIHTRAFKYDDLRVRLQVWDLGGQARFRKILPSYFRGSKGSFLVFDLTRRESLKSIPDWMEKIENRADASTGILVGNKADLKSLRSIDREEAEDMRDQISVNKYIETSAKTNQNIDKAFQSLVKAIVQRMKE